MSESVNHPVADMEQARDFIASLPEHDPVKMSQDAAQWLKAISACAAYNPARRFELIDLTDLALKPHGEKLLDQYLELKPQSKFQEAVLWKAALDFWSALGDAYLLCVSAFEADPAAAVAFGRMTALTARTARAQMLQIKWILMRYGYVSEGYWQTVARLYNFAEAGGYLDDIVDIYGGAHGRGTVRQELLRALMLGVSSTGGLSPVKQNIAERAIAHFSGVFVSGKSPAPGHNFVFDLNGGLSPARALVDPGAGARLLYFGAGKALDGAQKIIDAINDTGALLNDINLGPGENIDQMADTLLHLAFNWEKELPPRDSERRKVVTTLQITPGIDGVLLAGSHVIRETWIVENASAEGYGVIVPDRRGEWLQVGVLIGFLPEERGAAWGVGVVRRVESDARGQRHAGIQVLCRAAVPATMRTLQAAGGRGIPHSVILLDPEPSQSGYLQALLRPETFDLRETLEAMRSADGQSYALMPSGLVESGPDFDRVRFKLA